MPLAFLNGERAGGGHLMRECQSEMMGLPLAQQKLSQFSLC